MASVNKVILVGNLGQDPSVTFTAGGGAVCNVSLATTRSWKDKDSGERREETDWHRVVFFNKLAEIAGEYLKKGRSIYVEGRLQTRKYKDKEGVDRYTTEVIADQMQMLGGKSESAEAPARQSTASEYKAAREGSKAPPSFDDFENDAPPF